MLSQRSSSFIFATHLHEVAHLETIKSLQNVGIYHISVQYDEMTKVLRYDRILRKGSGETLYGLEVCKSLSLPDDFLTMAYNIREKYRTDSKSILSLKPSHYNSKKITNLCEVCKKNVGKEVHHLNPQKNASINGIIHSESGEIFHKNKLANLVSLCEECHSNFHKTDVKHKKVKTSKGLILREIDC
jgi:DNA mismatch repair protein MutS